MEIKEYSSIGNEVAQGGQTLVVGISINNSYFNQENLEKLKVWASATAQSVYIMIPDKPAVYTLMALGKIEQDAIRTARLKSNVLENKCAKIIQRLNLNSVKIVRWKDIVSNEKYQNTLVEIKQAYDFDAEFRMAVRSTTASVLQSGVGVETGIEFLFQELAFISQASQILGAGKIAYVYHKTMDILRDIIAGEYYFKADSCVGFITVE